MVCQLCHLRSSEAVPGYYLVIHILVQITCQFLMTEIFFGLWGVLVRWAFWCAKL